MHLVCYLRHGDKVFETYWTTRRGVEVMDNNYHLLDLTAYGRQETWEDSPGGWPQQAIMETLRVDGRPRPQWDSPAGWVFGRSRNWGAINRGGQSCRNLQRRRSKSRIQLWGKRPGRGWLALTTQGDSRR